MKNVEVEVGNIKEFVQVGKFDVKEIALAWRKQLNANKKAPPVKIGILIRMRQPCFSRLKKGRGVWHYFDAVRFLEFAGFPVKLKQEVDSRGVS